MRCPPSYPSEPHDIPCHGDVRWDKYYWLRNKRDPRVLRLIDEENAYTETMLRLHTPPGARQTIFEEMKSRWKETTAAFPVKRDKYWYFTRMKKDFEYAFHCRRPYHGNESFVLEWGKYLEKVQKKVNKKESHEFNEKEFFEIPIFSDEVTILDENILCRELGEGSAIDVGETSVSPDGNFIAFTVDLSNGEEKYTIFIVKIPSLLEYSSRIAFAKNKSMTDLSNSGIYKQRIEIQYRSKGKILRKKISEEKCQAPFQHFNHHSLLERVYLPLFVEANSTSRRTFTHHVVRCLSKMNMTDEICWIGTNGLCVVELDETSRPFRLIYHRLDVSTDSIEVDTVWYEEENTNFSISSLNYTSDWLFFLVSLSAAENTEWCIFQVFEDSSNISLLPCDGDELNPHIWDSSPVHSTFSCRPMMYKIASSRKLQVNYEIDHHPAIFGLTVGGVWIIVNDAHGCANFTIDFLLDKDLATENAYSEDYSHHFWPLFDYDESRKIDAVECHLDFLLIHGRENFLPIMWYCSVSTIARRFHERWEKTGLLPLYENFSESIQGGLINRESCLEWHCPLLSFKTDTISLKDYLQSLSLPQKLFVDHKLNIIDVFSNNSSFFTSELYLSISNISRPTRLLRTSVNTPDRWWLKKEDSRSLIENSSMLAERAISSISDNKELSFFFRDSLVLIHEAKVYSIPYNPIEYESQVLWVPIDSTPFPSDIGSLVDMEIASTENKKDIMPISSLGIPVIIYYRRDKFSKGKCPMYLTVYGSYGSCSDFEFISERLSLIDRGIVWAEALVRGGGDLGKGWHLAGKLAYRGNSIRDLLTVSAYVQSHGWCASGKLVIQGGSAGGTLVCAAVNAAPELFLGVVAIVPFVDCLTTLMDAKLPLTSGEWGEFGNPIESKNMYHIIKSYTPMENIPEDRNILFPHIFVASSLGDSRVGYWEPLAWTARLRERWSHNPKHTSRLLLHRCNINAGHAGSTGRYQSLRELAEEYAFVLAITKVFTN